MLTRIHLQNFAISSETEVELKPGMTVLTGETGAGKSILIDALNLTLGNRADTGVVRHGSDRAIIDTSFTVDANSPAQKWLQEHELDADKECHIRRVITAEGRSTAFINNSAVNLTTLKTLGESLVEIYGQHEHQSLTKAGYQRRLLDAAGNYQDLIGAVSLTAIQLKKTEEELNNLTDQAQENTARIELLRYQLDELEALSIDQLNIEELLTEHETILNAESLKSLSWETVQRLKEDDSDSLHNRITDLMADLRSRGHNNRHVTAILEILNDMTALTDEATHEMQNMHDSLETDPQRAEELDQLISRLHTLSRKHGISMQQLPEYYAQKNRELSAIDKSRAGLSELQTKHDALLTKYTRLSQQLHQERLAAAANLSGQVTDKMQQLGMQGGKFTIKVSLDEENHTISRHGRDNIHYMVSANPGQPPKPLHKVASGGELSRISLAITVICATQNEAPTMIFDEIDSGIGGAVAEIVGRELRSLAHSHQVLCVTHLPQVAAQGHQHFRIVKTSTKNSTESRVIGLDSETRTQEIARMLGGIEITEQSLAHAQELLGKL